jgi:hypothetical protein
MPEIIETFIKDGNIKKLSLRRISYNKADIRAIERFFIFIKLTLD